MKALTRSQQAADAVTEFCGSWTFIVIFAVLRLHEKLDQIIQGLK